MNSWKRVVLAQSKITKEWKSGGNDLVQSSLDHWLHLVETSLAWSRVEALVITTAAAMVVVVPKQTKEPFQSCYQVFHYFHKILLALYPVAQYFVLYLYYLLYYTLYPVAPRFHLQLVFSSSHRCKILRWEGRTWKWKIFFIAWIEVDCLTEMLT